jgi:hypothetical protein
VVLVNVREHIVNDIELTVINDGNGDQCGFNYHDRLSGGYAGDEELFFAAATNYNAQRALADSEPATRTELREAAKRLLRYYVEHAAECGDRGDIR